MIKENFSNISILNPIKFSEGNRANVFAKSVKSMPIQISDGIILIYLIDGSANIKISFNNYELNKGDFLLINKYEVYGIESKDDKNIILFLEIDCSYMFGKNEYFFAFDPLFYRTYNGGKVQEIIKSMINLFLAKNVEGFFQTQEIELQNIKDICIKYFQIQNFDPINKFESPLISSGIKLERIGNTFKYFYQNHQDKIKLDQVAEREFIDKFYASHLIKSGTGSSFFEMLNIVRIDRAEVLLLGTIKSIDEIASEAGFSSYQYFVQSFRQFFKITPTAYRKVFLKETYPNKQAVFFEIQDSDVKEKIADYFGLKSYNCTKKTFDDEEKNEILNILNEAEFFKNKAFDLNEIQQIVFKYK